jgi:RNA polymerase sigma-70 factor (ECF subfamily)
MDEAGARAIRAASGRTVSDGELARLVSAAGEAAAEAEEELCRRLAPRVRLYGLRHLRDAASADDLAQEVLLLTLERLRAGRIREPDRLASFVLGACRLVVRNLHRGRRRRAALLDRHAGLFASRAEPDLLPLDLDRLRECLGSLGPRERAVLVATVYAELPSAAIAAGLGLTPDNVRTVRHRAFVRVRDCVLGGAP